METSSKTSKDINKATKTSVKSKAPKKISELPLFATLPIPVMVGNQQYIPEPKTEEQHRIYTSQVLVPIYVSGKTHALSGPLADLDTDFSKLKEYFPSYHKCKLIGQAKKPRVELTTTEEPKTNEPIDLRFMNNDFRVFHVTPSFKNPTNCIEWLNKIEKTKAQNWKEMGIYDLIMLLKLGLEYISSMLVSSLYFWDNTHYTFHLPCGIITPTLFNLASITGLKPTRHTYDLDIDYEDTIAFSTSRAAYSTHIAHYHDKDTITVSDVVIPFCVLLEVPTSRREVPYTGEPTVCWT